MLAGNHVMTCTTSGIMPTINYNYDALSNGDITARVHAPSKP